MSTQWITVYKEGIALNTNFISKINIDKGCKTITFSIKETIHHHILKNFNNANQLLIDILESINQGIVNINLEELERCIEKGI